MIIKLLIESIEERFPGYIETAEQTEGNPKEILKLGYNKTDFRKILDQTLQA